MIDKFKLGSGLIRYIRGTPPAPSKPKFKYIRPSTASSAPTEHHLTSASKDHYSVLGVSRSASYRDIKQAYYKKAKEFHPDSKYSGAGSRTLLDEAKFKEITEAYEALMQEHKKGDSVIALNPELYKNITRERRQAIVTSWNAVNELNYEDVILSISFKEAAEGGRREVKLPIGTRCDQCSVWGTFPPIDKDGCCKVCQGTGKQTLQTENGKLWMTCKFCKGYRSTPHRVVCPKCHGKGIIIKTHPVLISIPKGSKNKDVISARITGHQRSVNIILNIQDIERFQVDGLNVHTTEEISLTQAVLGANIPIKGINGIYNVHIPPGTQPGAEIRTPGKGIWDAPTQQRGQHILKIKIRIPTLETARQRHLLKELDALLKAKSNN